MKNKVYLADCMDIMKNMGDKSVDLCIVDPPYGVNQGGGKNHTRGKLAIAKDYKDFGDTKSPDKEYFDELIRISKNQIIWGANHFISKIPYDSSCWIVWDKNNTGDFADCELAYTSFKTAVRRFKFTWNGMLQENMKDKEIRIHPTQKPVDLYKWLLQNYAKQGDKIFDSHVGSGSIRIACYDLGFDFWGCEKDKYYWQAQEKRFKDYLSQPKLFDTNEVEYKQEDLF